MCDWQPVIHIAATHKVLDNKCKFGIFASAQKIYLQRISAARLFKRLYKKKLNCMEYVIKKADCMEFPVLKKG